MTQSLSNILVHIVFSTKQRTSWLNPEICAELYPYIAQILKTKNTHPYRIGGTADHIHILCRLVKTISISALIEEIKTSTSKWIKTKKNFDLNDFHWQNGYGVFSISPGHLDIVTTYIANQLEHHKKTTFQEEFLLLLKKYKINYNEKYLWN